MTSRRKTADPAADDALLSTPAVAVPEDYKSSSYLKLPTFWPDSAEVWFAQTDAQFDIRNISSSRSKFYHAVAALPQEVASQILDLIRAPPLGDPYKVLRDRLIRLYMLNDYQRFESLVSLTLSGDQKPSHLMNRMLALYPDDHKPDFVLRGLFLRRLPMDVRSHLLREKVDDPIEMALKADELHQSRVSSSAVNILADDPGDTQVNLVSNHAKVPLRSGSAWNPPFRRSQTRNRSPSRSQTTAPSSKSSTSGICWYHRKHGDNASNCREPCSFSGNK